jgi:uncharacterized protein (DUF3820 family)
MSTQPTRCPKCDSINLIETTVGVPAPHHSKLICDECGHHVKWIAGPVEGFRMPFGKYKGSSLAEIDKTDRGYLAWIAGHQSFNAKLQAKVRQYLGMTPESRGIVEGVDVGHPVEF